MTVREFKKENNWGWTHLNYAGLQGCNNCHNRSIVFVATPVTDIRGHEWISGESQLVCHACGSHGFKTYASCWCKAWEGQHEN